MTRHPAADVKAPLAVRRPPLGLLAIIAVIVGALAALDWFLENTERRELHAQALRLYAAGSRLLKEGQADRAVEMLRRAHALDRRNEPYQLGLIDALMADRKIGDAEPLLNEILERDPDNGRADLTAARLAIRNGRTAEAESYYHRAIYGEWPGDPIGNRISARLELVNFLAANARPKDLLAELLPLEEDAGANPDIQKRIAHLFLTEGAPARAAEVYHALIQANPADADAWAGLGETELERGRYRAAQAAFLSAYRRKPDDPAIRGRMEMASSMTALDPIPRQLRPAEKFRRSVRILELARSDLEQCIASHPAPASSEITELLSEAQASVAVKASEPVMSELTEREIVLAERIWQARLKACGAAFSPAEQPLHLIMEKLAQ